MSLARFAVEQREFPGPVLVTGGAGCIGSWAIALLTQAEMPVVVFDLADDQYRPGLLMNEEQLAKATWVTGDIADSEAVAAVVAEHGIKAIVHLAALQVPFCKADPISGAKANVLGTINVFEAARQHGIKHLTYASSIAAHGFLGEEQWAATLYGAYKRCNEMCASVYHADWDVPSIGIRPGVVYGVGRDQGLTSKTTVAILAAAAGEPYTIPFSGPVSGLHAGEAAAAFLKAVGKEHDAAVVLDHNGVASSVEAWVELVQAVAPEADLHIEGDALPFPADLSNKPLRDYLGAFASLSLEEGVKDTYEAFRRLLDAELVTFGGKRR